MNIPAIPDEAVEAARLAVKEHFGDLVTCYSENCLSPDDVMPSAAGLDPLHTCVERVLAATAPAILAANGPRVVSSAADIRALGDAVLAGDCTDGKPMVVLMDDSPALWTVSANFDGPGPEPAVWMTTMWSLSRVQPEWLTDRVTDDGIAGHGPWRVVWSRGVKLP